MIHSVIHLLLINADVTLGSLDIEEFAFRPKNVPRFLNRKAREEITGLSQCLLVTRVTFQIKNIP